MDIGYKGPIGPNEAKNLPSALQHPLIIDAELAKECAAGHILGPFQSRPLTNLHCSGIGVVPKKNNKWRMIMHLSAPAGNSINDHNVISRDEFSLHYSSVDDAVKLLVSLGRGASMAKVDLKSAFRMVPVRKEDWQFLGIKWRDNFMWTLASHSACDPRPSSLTSSLKRSSGFSGTTVAYSCSFIT